MVCDLQETDEAGCGLFSINGKWKLVVQKDEWYWDEEKQTGISKYITYIYSLPGTGDASEDVMSPISPRKSSTRKYLRNDQVLIENTDHTYTVTGQEVR